MTVYAFADVIGTTVSFDAASDQILFPLGYSAGRLEWHAFGADTVVTWGSDSLTLSAINPGELDDSHFLFEDGSVFHLGDPTDEVTNGSPLSDLFDLRAGGEDTVAGGSGADRVIVGSALSAGDSINGGLDFDWIFLGGIYEETVVLADTTIRGVEFVVFEAGSTIRLQLSQQMLASVSHAVSFESAASTDAGVVLLDGREVTARIEASTAAGDDTLFGGAGKDRLAAGQGDNFIAGQGGDDWLGAGGQSTLLGGAGQDTLEADAGAGDLAMHGGSGSDRLKGGGGADVLYAAGWHDLEDGPVSDDVLASNEIFGGDGNDTLLGDAGRDTLDGGDGDDSLEGGGGNDFLQSGGGVDTLRGGEGNDTLSGGAQNFLDGGAGDDTYYVSSQATVIVEAPEGGSDRVWVSGGTYTLPDEVERGELGFSGVLAGNVLSNELYGSDQADTLLGGDGDDLLTGHRGADRLEGGDGNDTYIVDADDIVVEHAGGGRDRVIVNLNRYVVPLGAEFETVELAKDLTGMIVGNAADNWLVANQTSCTLMGGGGNDTLEGSDSWAVLSGGKGNDVYLVIDDRVELREQEDAGEDLVKAAVNWTLGAFHENLTLVGSASSGAGNRFANVVRGNARDNFLDGRAGADTLFGGAGNDRLIVDNAGDVVVEKGGEGVDTVSATVSYSLSSNVENLILSRANTTGRGNGLNNRLSGGAGEQVLDGAAGVDTMEGGEGNDTYIVNHRRDMVIEDSGLDRDTVKSVVNFTLAENVENLVLIGSRAFQGIGNGGHNLIVGNASNNTIYGRGGNDTLQGGAGRDTLVGGTGRDTYYVDSSADVVVEDTDRTSSRPDLVISTAGSYRLGAFVEDLTLAGARNLSGFGNALRNTLRGNSGNNRLDGGGGADQMFGGRGNDSYVVDDPGDRARESIGGGVDTVLSSVSFRLGTHVENLILTGTRASFGVGNTLANVMQGNSGANQLDGGTGADTMRGGGGNDVYVVDDARDVIVEGARAGNDSVRSSVSYALAANVENLFLYGDYNETINGRGNASANLLVGSEGGNTLDGGAGADTMKGGDGADIYFVDDPGDRVVEESQEFPERADSVVASVDFTLSLFVDILVLVGDAIRATGNADENLLVGNAQDNVLIGGNASDQLHGGDGNDRFVFRTAVESGPTSWDLIDDFRPGQDKIDLSLLDGNPTTPGVQPFQFIGSTPFSFENGASGQLRYEAVRGGIVLYGSTDSDTDAEFVLALAGVTGLSEGDFLF